MLDKLRRLFRARQSSLPDPKTQANIGKLAVYYLDKALTRIDVLVESRKYNAAKTEYEILQKYFEQLNNNQISNEFQRDVSSSPEIELAIEYVDKLFRLVNDLLEASSVAAAADRIAEARKRTEEATALKIYFDEITRRVEKLRARFQSIIMKLGNRK